MKTRSLRSLVLLTGGVFLFGLVILFGTVITQFKKLDQFTAYQSQRTQTMRLALDIKYHVVQIQQFLTDASLVHDEDPVKEARENLVETEKRIDEIKENEPHLTQEVEKIRAKAIILNKTGVEMYEAYTKQGKDAGDKIMKREGTGLDAASESLAGEVEKLIVNTQTDYQNAEKQVALIKTQTFQFLLTISILVAATVFFMLFKVYSWINPTRPIIGSLEDQVHLLKTRADDIVGISSGLSKTVAEQTSALEQSASAIEEITGMVAKTDENAKNLVSVSQDSQAKATEGKQAFEHSVQSITELRNELVQMLEDLQKNNDKVMEIQRVISEIATKTTMINDIVFQTKLLSFNASVEAARAGEAGKGFAVVAEEVGNLAAQSGKAAIEINQMIDESSSKVKAIVGESSSKTNAVIATARKKLEESVQTLSSASHALMQVVEGAELVRNQASEISNAVAESTKGIELVSETVRTLQRASDRSQNSTQTGTRVASDVNQSASDLNEIASKLSLLIRGTT